MNAVYPPISDYAMISNCRVSALIGRAGSIDWLCLPQPHSPAAFWALLDDRRGGFWRIGPADDRTTAHITRRYVPRTMVLETTFARPTGTFTLTDALQVEPPDHRGMVPDLELTRTIECTRGEVTVESTLAPRPGFGRWPVRMERCRTGLVVCSGRYTMLVAGQDDARIDDDARTARHRWRLREGERRTLALSHTDAGPGVWPASREAARDRTHRTIKWWRSWSDLCKLPPDDPEPVRRSALVLKSLSYPPTGAVLAAPTTSLPEAIGGSRNWDYRYCWIRDASFTMRALLNLGVEDDAAAFFNWLLNATRRTRPKLRVLYDVHGRTSVPERELAHLDGYRHSRPVRIGNGARHQRQLDTYGALLDAAHIFHHEGGHLSLSAGRMLAAFVRYASHAWRKPDHGIWEIRAEPRHHTVSKAMCWVAMHCGLALEREGVMKLDRQAIEAERDECARTIRDHATDPDTGAYTATLDGTATDASLLLLSIYGFEPPDSPRMLATIDTVYERLGPHAALFRYRNTEDGLEGHEHGRFGICGFWGVEALAMAGRLDEARAAFDELLTTGSELGLFSEEIDTDNHAAIGNYPQALTHLGLINAACTLSDAARNGWSSVTSGATL